MSNPIRSLVSVLAALLLTACAAEDVDAPAAPDPLTDPDPAGSGAAGAAGMPALAGSGAAGAAGGPVAGQLAAGSGAAGMPALAGSGGAPAAAGGGAGAAGAAGQLGAAGGPGAAGAPAVGGGGEWRCAAGPVSIGCSGERGAYQIFWSFPPSLTYYNCNVLDRAPRCDPGTPCRIVRTSDSTAWTGTCKPPVGQLD